MIGRVEEGEEERLREILKTVFFTELSMGFEGSDNCVSVTAVSFTTRASITVMSPRTPPKRAKNEQLKLD